LGNTVDIKEDDLLEEDELIEYESNDEDYIAVMKDFPDI